MVYRKLETATVHPKVHDEYETLGSTGNRLFE